MKGEISMTYVQGSVAAVPNSRKVAFKTYAQEMVLILKEMGAISSMDCWGDDVPQGTLTSFPMAVKLKDDETVVFSWIVWPSKEVANRAMAKFMEDPRFNQQTNPMPFDGKRMIYGGFVPLVEV
jgi:uncharacterized protein YbaA (DUF1428 family)